MIPATTVRTVPGVVTGGTGGNGGASQTGTGGNATSFRSAGVAAAPAVAAETRGAQAGSVAPALAIPQPTADRSISPVTDAVSIGEKQNLAGHHGTRLPLRGRSVPFPSLATWSDTRCGPCSARGSVTFTCTSNRHTVSGWLLGVNVS